MLDLLARAIMSQSPDAHEPEFAVDRIERTSRGMLKAR
jgi:hypothetical protein